MMNPLRWIVYIISTFIRKYEWLSAELRDEYVPIKSEWITKGK